MVYRFILYSLMLFVLGQAIVWIQVNGPIIWPWAKKYKLLLILCGVPITYLFMEATRLAVLGFEGAFWPGRFLSFVSGIIIFSILTYMFCNEGINMKTMVSLLLAIGIIFIQLFWK